MAQHRHVPGVAGRSCGELTELRHNDLIDEADRWGLGRRAAGAVLDQIKFDAVDARRDAGHATIAAGGDADVVAKVDQIVRRQLATLL